MSETNIFLIGPMGAGKTSIGKQIAKELERNFYDSDAVIEQRAGADIPWIFDVEGEMGLRDREAKVIVELTQKKDIVLATGGNVVALKENREALAANGTIVYLQTSLEEQIKRTSQSKKRPLAKEQEKRRETLQNLAKEYKKFYEDLADLTYGADEQKSVTTVAKDIIKKLKQKDFL